MTKVVLKCPSCGHMIDFGPNWVPVDISTPMTHADVIRSMNDEALADFLDDVLTNGWNAFEKDDLQYPYTDREWLDYLRSPVVEEADDDER